MDRSFYNIPELKAQFAEAILRAKEPEAEAFQIAWDLTSGDNNFANEISRDWLNDPEVRRIQQQLVEANGLESFLPSKYDVLKKLFKIADSTPSADDKIKALRTYSEIAGFIEKNPKVVNNNTNGNTTQVRANKVMLIPVSTSDDDWFEKVKQQQANLRKNAEDV